MTEVNDFLSRNPDLGSELRDFVRQHETLRDVWGRCPAWYWMLDLLDRCHYRNAEGLEKYIDRQSQHIEDVSEEAIEATWQMHFSYQQGAKQIEAEVEAGVIGPSEARRRRFIWARIVAHEIERVRFNNACAPIIEAEVGIELPLTDETEVGRSVLTQQADELREIHGNPFQFDAPNDFYNGEIALNAF